MIDKAEPVSPNGQPSLNDRVRELVLSNRLDGGKTGKSSSSSAWLPWLLCILMAIAWAGVGIRAYKNPGGGGNSPSSEAVAPAQTAGAAAPTAAKGEVVLESKGYLIPSHQISVSPIDVAGRITELNIEEGQTFKKGDTLAVIDSTRYEADKAEAEAQLAGARAKLAELRTSSKLETQQAEFEIAEARAQMAEASVVYETAKTTASGAVAKLEVNQAAKKYDATAEHVKVLETKLIIVQGEPRKQRIMAAERELEAAQARLNRASWAYDNCTIKSPVTGVILTKKAEVGSLINPVVGGISTSLCEIADLSQIEVDLEIQERDIAKLRVGMLGRVRPDAYPDRIYTGFVDRLMPIANRARGIIPVRVRVVFPPKEEQGKYLKPEMGVSVTFINQDVDPAVKSAAERAPEGDPKADKVKTKGDKPVPVDNLVPKMEPTK